MLLQFLNAESSCMSLHTHCKARVSAKATHWENDECVCHGTDCMLFR